jgi:hypothetical protein
LQRSPAPSRLRATIDGWDRGSGVLGVGASLGSHCHKQLINIRFLSKSWPLPIFQNIFIIVSRRRGQCAGHSSTQTEPQEMTMPKFVIERDIPGAGKLSPADLKTISLKSCGVLSSMGPSVQWVHSYVTADRIYCIYHASDESLVRRHAELGGFPANKISRVTTIIDPATAE